MKGRTGVEVYRMEARKSESGKREDLGRGAGPFPPENEPPYDGGKPGRPSSFYGYQKRQCQWRQQVGAKRRVRAWVTGHERERELMTEGG